MSEGEVGTNTYLEELHRRMPVTLRPDMMDAGTTWWQKLKYTCAMKYMLLCIFSISVGVEDIRNRLPTCLHNKCYLYQNHGHNRHSMQQDTNTNYSTSELHTRPPHVISLYWEWPSMQDNSSAVTGQCLVVDVTNWHLQKQYLTNTQHSLCLLTRYMEEWATMHCAKTKIRSVIIPCVVGAWPPDTQLT